MIRIGLLGSAAALGIVCAAVACEDASAGGSSTPTAGLDGSTTPPASTTPGTDTDGGDAGVTPGSTVVVDTNTERSGGYFLLETTGPRKLVATGDAVDSQSVVDVGRLGPRSSSLGRVAMALFGKNGWVGLYVGQ